MSLDQLTQFFGWCSVINIGLLLVSSMALTLMKGPIARIHSRIMSVPEAGLPQLYFQFLAHYKIVILAFNVVPYIALKIMAQSGG